MYETNQFDFWFIVLMGILTVLILLVNGLGIYCLYMQKQRNDTQKIILLNLSSVGIIVTVIVDILYFTQHFSRNLIISRYRRILWNLIPAAFCVYYLTMFLITVDRLLCVVLTIKYNYYITKCVIKRTIFVYG